MVPMIALAQLSGHTTFPNNFASIITHLSFLEVAKRSSWAPDVLLISNEIAPE